MNKTNQTINEADAKFFAEAFTNPTTNQPYDIPDNLKRLSSRLCRSYGIRGVCDPMHIANVIAVELTDPLATQHINQLEAELERVKADRDNAIKAVNRLRQQRDEWRATAQEYIGAYEDLSPSRDELLAALNTAADWFARSTRIDDLEQVEDMRAAIAKHERGNQ